MQRISAYQATDGRLFNNKGECREHQKALNIIAAVELITDKVEVSNGEYDITTDSGELIKAMTANQVSLFILENADAIRAALAGKLDEVTEILIMDK